MSIEAITSLWEAKTAEAAAKRREADLIEAEARGLLMALEALRGTSRPTHGTKIAGLVVHGYTYPQNSTNKRSGPGRQPGSISNKWKRHLLQLRELGDVFSVEDVIRLVNEREDRIMKPSEVQRLFGKFSTYGYVKFFDEGLFTVSEDTVQKFRASIGSDVDVTGEEESEDHDEDENNTSSAMSFVGTDDRASH